MMATQVAGNVIVAPNVLVNLVELGLREVPGIARPGNVPRARGQYRGDGIALSIHEREVGVDCYLIAQPDTNLLECVKRDQLHFDLACRNSARQCYTGK
jgi:hypothetical protein